MNLFGRILLPVEGSQSAMAIVQDVIELAREENSDLLLVAIIDESIRDMLARYTHRSPEAVQQDLEDSEQRYLRHVAQLAQQAGVPVKTTLRVGVAHHEVLAEARESDATCIVLGRSGEHGLRGLMMGRILRQIITASHCPVLVLDGAE